MSKDSIVSKDCSFDGIDLFKKELNKIKYPYYLKDNTRNKIKQRLAWILVGIKLWIDGNIDFKDAILNIIPARFFKNQNEKHEVREKVRLCTYQNLDKLLRFYGLYKFNTISLFGNSFYPAAEKPAINSWLHTFEFISQSIICDQYNAKKFIKEDSVIIDAGGNIGVFAVFAANLAPKGHVYCFEPAPETFEILKKNTALYSNITIFQKALGETEKNTELIISEDISGANTLVDSGTSSSSLLAKKKVIVNVITLDKFIEEFGIKTIDFIKMDVEGYEKNIIQGAKNVIRRNSPIMAMSAYHHKDDKKELPALVKSIDLDYKFRIDTKSEEELIFYK